MKRRKRLLLTITLLTLFKGTSSYGYLDITKQGYEQYQDIIINGEVVQKATHNHQDGEARFAILDQVLQQYKRPFTMLDIGASQGYYSFKAAQKYPQSVFVMIEGNNQHYPLIGTQLLDLCKENTALNNIVLLNKAIELADLQRLGECEHFGVVVVFNIIHWFDDWKTVTDAILNLGKNIIIETPPQEPQLPQELNTKRQQIIDYLIAQGAQTLGYVKRHTSNTQSPIFWIQTNKHYLERKTWLSKQKLEQTHEVLSDFNKKELHKKVSYPPDTYQTTPWIPGINLLTFKMYNGTYPEPATLKEAVRKLPTNNHNDWIANNMIVAGNQLHMIDSDDPTHAPGGLDSGRRFCSKFYLRYDLFFDLHDRKDIEKFFWNRLVGVYCNKDEL
jgi:hypothetical protein